MLYVRKRKKYVYHKVESIKFITPDNIETSQSGVLGKLEK